MVLKVEHVTFEYEENKPILTDVSLELKSGEIVGISGRNGSGKSTLMKLIAGYIKPDSGEVICEDIKAYEMGVMIDRPAVYEDMTVSANLDMADRLHGVKNFHDDALVEAIGLDQFMKVKAGKLSFGNMQKLGIAMVVGDGTKLLIIDEPFNGLDVMSKNKLIAYLKKKSKAGLAILMTSHIKGDYDLLCDRVVTL